MMPPRLGLVCITTSDLVRYRTITRTRLMQYPREKQCELLGEIYRNNIERLYGALQFCRREDIFLYRIPSSIFPFLDDDIGREVMTTFIADLASVGKEATAANIRLVTHPDQFVVLSSDSEKVVANSIKILQMHADMMDFLMQPRSPWALIEIHGGKSGRGKELVARIKGLPDAIRSRLALENDEYAYSADQIHAICVASGLPMVFDAHHHIVHEQLSSYDEPSIDLMLTKARETWAVPDQQLVHISNGRAAFNDRQHADYIDVMPSCYRNAPWIEVEAKSKELAIQRVRERWH